MTTNPITNALLASQSNALLASRVGLTGLPYTGSPYTGSPYTGLGLSTAYNPLLVNPNLALA